MAQVAPSLADELRSYLTRHRQEVKACIEAGGEGAGILAGCAYAKTFDGLLLSLFQAVHAALLQSGRWQPTSLAAVGSYGRGAVAFSSDLDVRLLAHARLEDAQEIAEALLYPLWDSGLTIGHQVVTASALVELARGDLPTATSLLDWRVVAGDPKPSRGLLRRAFEGVFGVGQLQHFLDRIAERAAERHARYGGSVYVLEPDVKNGPGGLRDLDVAHWAARARWQVAELPMLVKYGVLVPREWQPIAEAREFMWQVRNQLHVHAGRRSDRLSFDRQEQIAEHFGYGCKGPDVERFMRDYYRHARQLVRARDMLLARAAPPPIRRTHVQRIKNGFTIVGGALTLSNPKGLEEDPPRALELVYRAVRRGLPLHEHAREAVARVSTLESFGERLRQSPEAARWFTRLLTTATRTRFKNGSVLGELHDIGLLCTMIPEFSPVVGRVHHDVYHVYTVDAHSVAAVDRLRSLVRGELAGEFPLASRLAAEVARKNVLYFATLLHDVGKDIGGRNHSQRGAKLANAILNRIGLAPDEIAQVGHLILNHLRMYHVATRRDIDDPKTLADFEQAFNEREGLRELYLLTVADVSTTSPTAMTSWKARMLDELFWAADSALDGGITPRSAGLEPKRTAVAQRFKNEDERRFVEHFLRAIPERYLHANDAADITEHARFVQQSERERVSMRTFSREDDYIEIGLVADDRPGLLAMFTAALSAARLDVVGAQIYVWIDGSGRLRALDLFWVRGSGAAALETQLSRLDKYLQQLVGGEVDPAELVTRKEAAASLWSTRRMPPVKTKVVFDDRASAHTVLEVHTRDRLGLLFHLAHTLQDAGLTIALAKINTEGASIADVFYVTDAAGAKLSDPQRIQEIRSRILATVAKLSETEQQS